MKELESHFIKTNEMVLHTKVGGPENGPLLILLHGFPEFWYGWKNQIHIFAEAGYRVVVPDQRGYNLSDKPKGLGHYTMNVLRDDIIGLIDHFQREKATIVGHDWGALMAWHIAATRPDRVKEIIPINAPHPAVFMEKAVRYPIQIVRSSYILFFQLPTLPEKTLQDNGYGLVKKMMQFTSNKGTFSHGVLRTYEVAWSQEGALTSMLNWYRALRAGSLDQLSKEKIKVPVHLIWGKGDAFLSFAMAKESMSKCIEGRFTMVEEATHWIHHEQPYILNRLIME
ncbi:MULTISPECIES: alpha/beta fold hydrolase [Bacillaceae]|uniref:Alpha/beta hydrolase n=1 Tax=Evansella alkalicola TaxID=745819 RepID=A0ABS6JZ43_9BACI|nr:MULTISPECIES: alpha/beta hydrolase [Bacillaceae]MBU9723361.1 alpha/beta hydrolase [Bacillus alkalicola]